MTAAGRPPYPPSPARPEHNTIGGIDFVDPYQWLEQDSDEVRAWQAAQNALTDQLLTAQASLAATFARHLDECFVDTFAYFAPREIAGRWWRQYRPTGQDFQVLAVADTATDPGRIVFDCNGLPGATRPLLSSWEPSPDGRLLCVGVSDAGQPITHRVIDLASGHVLLDGLGDPGVMFVAWGPGGDELYYSATELDAAARGPPRPVARLYRQPVAAGAKRQLEPVEFPHPAVWPVLSADRRYLIAMMDQTAARPAYLKDLATGIWRPFLRDLAATCKGHVAGDEYIGVTTHDAPRGRVVAVPLGRPADPQGWRVVVPESEAKVASVTPVGDHLVVGEFINGRARLRAFTLDGRERQEVPLPGEGAVGKSGVGHILSIIDDVVHPGSTGISFVYTSISRSPAAYHWSPAAGLTEVAPPKAELADVTVELRHAESRDGTSVPYRIYRPRDASRDAAVLINGYGGFNVPWLPAYDSMAAAWLRAGGIWVHAHLRGGGEFGTQWWHGGRMHRKQGTFDDLHAVGQALIDGGVAQAGRLGVLGSSNGGLLAGAAVVQRPDLYAASVSQVPVLDLLRYKNDVTSFAIAVADYGNPDVPADARALYACSPYHNVEEGVRYPAVLFDAGANDTACPPWHSRKMAARLQQATAGERPILLRVRPESGHNAMSEQQARERMLEELVFLAWQTGLVPA